MREGAQHEGDAGFGLSGLCVHFSTCNPLLSCREISFHHLYYCVYAYTYGIDLFLLHARRGCVVSSVCVHDRHERFPVRWAVYRVRW